MHLTAATAYPPFAGVFPAKLPTVGSDDLRAFRECRQEPRQTTACVEQCGSLRWVPETRALRSALAHGCPNRSELKPRPLSERGSLLMGRTRFSRTVVAFDATYSLPTNV